MDPSDFSFHKSNFLFLFLFPCQFSYFIQICYPWATCKLVFIAYLIFYSIFSSENSKISFHLFPVWGGASFLFLLSVYVIQYLIFFEVSLVQFSRGLCWSFFFWSLVVYWIRNVLQLIYIDPHFSFLLIVALNRSILSLFIHFLNTFGVSGWITRFLVLDHTFLFQYSKVQ